MAVETEIQIKHSRKSILARCLFVRPGFVDDLCDLGQHPGFFVAEVSRAGDCNKKLSRGCLFHHQLEYPLVGGVVGRGDVRIIDVAIGMCIDLVDDWHQLSRQFFGQPSVGREGFFLIFDELLGLVLQRVFFDGCVGFLVLLLGSQQAPVGQQPGIPESPSPLLANRQFF